LGTLGVRKKQTDPFFFALNREMLLSTESREPRQAADRAVLGGAPGLGHAEPARGQLDRLEAAVVKIAQLLERLEQRERTRDGEGPDDALPHRLCAAPSGGGGGGGVLGVMVPAEESEAAHDGDFSSAIGPCACGPRCCWSRVTLEQPWGSRLEFVRALLSYVTLSFIANEIMMSNTGIRDLVGLYDTVMIVATLLCRALRSRTLAVGSRLNRCQQTTPWPLTLRSGSR
jgi:hypothetical protein